MTQQPARSFDVADRDADERASSILWVLSTIVALQRYNGFWPSVIWLNSDVYILIGSYMGTCRVDRLFNVPVRANLNKDALPFIIQGEYTRSNTHGH